MTEIRGGNGNDYLRGTMQDDDIYGNGGDDFIVALKGADYIRAGGDNDRVFGGAGNDRIHGDYGNDVINGGRGDDFIFAGRGSDTIILSQGEDKIDGNQADGSHYKEDRDFIKVPDYIQLDQSTKDTIAQKVSDYHYDKGQGVYVFNFENANDSLDIFILDGNGGSEAQKAENISGFIFGEEVGREIISIIKELKAGGPDPVALPDFPTIDPIEPIDPIAFEPIDMPPMEPIDPMDPIAPLDPIYLEPLDPIVFDPDTGELHVEEDDDPWKHFRE
ncbi:MAG: hypothetical protein AAF228_09320 [Pseudomonadota bacterium]